MPFGRVIELRWGWLACCGATLVALAALLGGCGGGSAGSTTEAESRKLPDRFPGASVAVVERPEPRQSENLPLLRTPPEGLPPEVTGILRQPTFGMNWELAQRIPTSARGRFWVVPGRGVLCVLGQEDTESVSSNCTKTPHAIAHGLAAILVSENPSPAAGESRYRRLMVGIAPNGARAMRVYTDGSIHVARVVEGAFTLRDREEFPPQKMVPVGS
jgi:hypothetical protein